MIIERKKMMSVAWRQARLAAKRFGGKASQYFAECLKQQWNLLKALYGKAKSMFTATPKASPMAHRGTIGGIGKSTSKPQRVHKVKRYARSQMHLDPLSRTVGYYRA